jgi:zinc protease
MTFASPRALALPLKILLIGAFALNAAGAATASKSDASGALEPVRAIEGVTEYRLPNGLQILLYPDSSSTTVSVNVTYRVGSRNESYGETGMAHLLEHMNFKGTPAHPNIPAELSSHGASANATTAHDRTNYFETFPAGAANVDWALGLESDRMVHSFIAQKDLDSEMTVVRNEFESGENNPVVVLQERVLQTAYLWHNYGHPTIGARADIEGVPIGRLQGFYHTFYQPDNATLIVTGKFEPMATLAAIRRSFGVVPKPLRVLPAFYTAEPTQDGEREVTLRRSGSQPLLMEAYHIPADAHPDSVALGVLVAMLNLQPSGLLYQKLIDTKLAVAASADADSMHDPGHLLISVSLPKGGDVDAVRRALAAVIETVRTQPFPKAELERVRNEQFNDYERLMNSSADVSALLSENVGVGDWRLAFWDRDQLHQVTVQDTLRVAAKYLVDTNRTVGIFTPEEKSLRAVVTPAPDIDTLLKGYAGQAAVADGEHFEATPAAIEARVKRGSVGGIKTAFLDKKTRGDRVSGVVTFHFGDETALQNKGDVAAFTAALLMRGTTVHTRQQIQDELTRLKTTMNVGGGATGVQVVFESPSENLSPALRLAAEIVRHPAFPAAEIDEIKRASLAGIENARTDPGAIARLAAQRYLSPYPPADYRYVPTLDEHSASLKRIAAADIQAFYAQFYGAGSGEAALVGHFDSAAVSKQLGELFGGWTGATPYRRVKSIYKLTAGTSQTFNTPDKANAILTSAANLALRDDDADYPALIVGNEVLGGGFLNSRLATRIRQKEGLSYTVGSRISADSEDPVGSFSFYAICAPQNVAKVERDAHEEIARVLADGLTAPEVSAAKTGILQSLILARSSDAALAGDIANHLYLNRDFGWDARVEKSIDTVSAEQIQKAMRRHIDPARMFTVKAGDFAKAGG